LTAIPELIGIATLSSQLATAFGHHRGCDLNGKSEFSTKRSSGLAAFAATIYSLLAPTPSFMISVLLW